jgi:hypothetical protein
MGEMNWRQNTLARRLGDVGLLVFCPMVAAGALIGGALPIVGLIALLGLTVAVYIGARHPLWLYWCLAVALGALPFGYFPGVHLPLTFGLGVAVLLAALLHPTAESSLSRIEVAILLLVLASAVSVVVTGRTVADFVEFIKWSVSVLMVIALLRLSRDNLARFGRIYVYASAAAAILALIILANDPDGRLIRYLKIVGYGREKEATRYVYSAAGKTVRLAGTYIDPNTAGIGLLVALMICFIVLNGWVRTIVAMLFLVAILLTLSRAATFSALSGVVLVLLFHTMHARHRRFIFGAVGVVIVAALATPQVRRRVFSSFGSEDVGSSAREDALANYPHQMAGHWWFGLGWGREEFKSGATGFTLNHVANAPLLTVYRGGIITGLIFVAVLVIGGVMAYRTLRSSSLAYAALGGVYIAFCVIALQLDFPTVTIPAVTMMFSVFIAFLIYVDQTSHLELSAKSVDTASTSLRHAKVR